jgi:hypothetical protein
VYDSWRREWGISVGVLSERLEALAQQNVGTELSLVSPALSDGADGVAAMSEGTELCVVVRWGKFRHRRLGQKCKLDASRRVKYPWHAPMVDFSCSELVHPAIGVSLESTTSERPTLPFAAWRLRSMWQTGRALGYDAGNNFSTTVQSCVVCSSGAENVEQCLQFSREGANDDDGDAVCERTVRCPMCMLAWHPSCSRTFVGCELVEARLAEEPVFCGPEGFLPSSAFCILCHACSRRSGRESVAIFQ